MKRMLRTTLRVLLVLFVVLNIITAFHAYKFTHYYEAAEVVLKKPEEKSTWEKVGEIFFGIKYPKKLNDPKDSMFSDVILSTKEGLKLSGWYASADSATGTVILFHGHGGNRTGVVAEAKEFYNLHYNVFLLDFRAHGNSQGNTCTIGFDEAEDVMLAYRFIKSRDEDNVILWGISLGAATITRAIHKYHLQPSKIILELPFASVMRAVKSRVRMMGLPAQPISTLLTFWGGFENGFWAFEHKPSEYVKSVTCPVLLQFGSKDIRVGKDEAYSIFENITSPKQIVFYENCGHESLCKKENQKWKSTVTAFLQGK